MDHASSDQVTNLPRDYRPSMRCRHNVSCPSTSMLPVNTMRAWSIMLVIASDLSPIILVLMHHSRRLEQRDWAHKRFGMCGFIHIQIVYPHNLGYSRCLPCGFTLKDKSWYHFLVMFCHCSLSSRSRSRNFGSLINLWTPDGSGKAPTQGLLGG